MNDRNNGRASSNFLLEQLLRYRGADDQYRGPCRHFDAFAGENLVKRSELWKNNSYYLHDDHEWCCRASIGTEFKTAKNIINPEIPSQPVLMIWGIL